MSRYIFICTTIALIALSVLVSSYMMNKKAPEKINNTIGNHAVVLELFSSEGCSSCPPAARVVDEIIAKAEKENEPIYLLDFHVDYWDYLGWKDTLAKSEFTSRQKKYSETMNLRSMYTPQLVVNGTKETVGSDKAKAAKLINEELNKPATVSLTCTTKTDKEHNSVAISYEASAIPNNAALCYAVAYNQVTDKILRGENRGKTLMHRYAVRSLEEQSLTDLKGTKTISHLPSNCSVLVFIQDKTSMQILAACPVKL